jgi:molecular chaperone GrpE
MPSKKQSAADAPDYQIVNEALLDMQQKIIDLTTALQQERADAMNLRRRHEAEIANVRTRLKASVVADLLPVIDNFERALKHVPEDLADNDYIKGVQGVVKQFEKTLADMGVERIKTVGEVFDPTYHEAISMEEGDGTQEIVSEELQAGYKLGDDVIRHAMVRVHLA